MKNNILSFPFALILSILLLCGLNCSGFIKDDSTHSSSADEAGIVSYWLDTETATVHKMVTVNEKSRVVSIIRYSNGVRAEVMDIIRSEIVDGKVKWAYYVPSTGYTVEMKAVLSNDYEVPIEWNNRDADGETDFGDDVLIRCKEDGTGLSPHNSDMLYDTLEE